MYIYIYIYNIYIYIYIYIYKLRMSMSIYYQELYFGFFQTFEDSYVLLNVLFYRAFTYNKVDDE